MSIADRRAAEKRQRRESIIDAGEAIFRKKGFEKATLADVAAQAELSRALLYVYFADKDDLAIAIKARALRLLREDFEAASAQPKTGLERIHAIGRAYIEYSVKRPMYFDAMGRFEMPEKHAAADAPEHHQLAAKEGQRIFEVMVEAIVAGMKDGSIRSDIEDPLKLSVTLWAQTHGVIMLGDQQQSVLQKQGITTTALVENAFWLFRQALTPR